MSNVHRLGDYQNLPESNREAQVTWGPPASALDKIPFYGMRQQGSGNPKEESFLRMLYLSFCPKLKLKSFTTLVTLVILTMFILTLSIGGVFTAGGFLQTESDTMLKLGAMNQDKLLSGEVYRLISAVFLHWDFVHILFNSIAILSCLSFLEKSYGIIAAASIFILGGIGGNIFSASANSLSPTIYAGASTAIFAIVGCWISFVILNWQGLKNVVGSEVRCLMCCMVAMNTFMIWIMSSIAMYGGTPQDDATKTDSLGHLGGWLTGIWVGLWIPAPMEQSNWTKGCKFTGYATSFTWFTLNFVLFYTTK